MVLGQPSMVFSGVMALFPEIGMKNKSNYVRKEPCPECGSKDNLAIYDDGHGFVSAVAIPNTHQKKDQRKDLLKL